MVENVESNEYSETATNDFHHNEIGNNNAVLDENYLLELNDN